MRQLAGVGAPTSLRRCPTTYTTAERPHHIEILYDIPGFHARGGFCRDIFIAAVCMGALLLTLCGSVLHSVFVFHPAPRGRQAPGDAAVKIYDKEMGK